MNIRSYLGRAEISAGTAVVRPTHSTVCYSDFTQME